MGCAGRTSPRSGQSHRSITPPWPLPTITSPSELFPAPPCGGWSFVPLPEHSLTAVLPLGWAGPAAPARGGRASRAAPSRSLSLSLPRLPAEGQDRAVPWPLPATWAGISARSRYRASSPRLSPAVPSLGRAVGPGPPRFLGALPAAGLRCSGRLRAPPGCGERGMPRRDAGDELGAPRGRRARSGPGLPSAGSFRPLPAPSVPALPLPRRVCRAGLPAQPGPGRGCGERGGAPCPGLARLVPNYSRNHTVLRVGLPREVV